MQNKEKLSRGSFFFQTNAIYLHQSECKLVGIHLKCHFLLEYCNRYLRSVNSV